MFPKENLCFIDIFVIIEFITICINAHLIPFNDFGLQSPDYRFSIFDLEKVFLVNSTHLAVISVDKLEQLLVIDVLINIVLVFNHLSLFLFNSLSFLLLVHLLFLFKLFLCRINFFLLLFILKLKWHQLVALHINFTLELIGLSFGWLVQ